MAAGWVVEWLGGCVDGWFSGSVGGACVLRTCQPQHKQKTQKIVCKDFFCVPAMSLKTKTNKQGNTEKYTLKKFKN